MIAPASKMQEMVLQSNADLLLVGGAAGCVDGDTEFLSSTDGWVKIKDYKNQDVLQYNTKTQEISYVTPKSYIKERSDGFFKIKTGKLVQLVSKEHNLLVQDGEDMKKVNAIDFVSSPFGFFKTAFNLKNLNVGLENENLIRLKTIIKLFGETESGSDFNITTDNPYLLNRIVFLCDSLGFKYSVHEYDGFIFSITVYINNTTTLFKEFGYTTNPEIAKIVIQELTGNDFDTLFITDRKSEADLIQYYFALIGATAHIKDNGKYYVVEPSMFNECSCRHSKIDWLKPKKNEFKYCFEVPTGVLVLRKDNKIFLTGNSGKTYTSSIIPLRYVHDPNFNCVFFRRTSVQSRGLGGTFETLKEIYNQLPKQHRPKVSEGAMLFKFPSGAKIKCSHLEHEKDKINHQGLQYSLIIFDEGTHFSVSQIDYLMSRLRSSAEGDSRMVITTNPDPDHKLREIVDWYIGSDGRPDPEKNGVVRYYIKQDGDYIWSDDKEGLEHLCTEQGERPMSFQAIFGTIYDNPICIEKNPGYLTFLKSLDTVEKERLFYGNWDVRAAGNSYFKREWLRKADKIPPNSQYVRAWDKASSIPTKATPAPDYTASIGMAKSPSGDIYIYGNFHENNKDMEEPEIYGRFRKLVGERDFIIEQQAIYDDPDQTIVILPQDIGQAGKFEYIASAQRLSVRGIIVKQDPINPHTSKLMRATPFFSAAENNYVYIVENSFNKPTLEAYLKELEMFNGERSSTRIKDDWIDATASAFNYLVRAKGMPQVVVRNQHNCPTAIHGVVENRMAV